MAAFKPPLMKMSAQRRGATAREAAVKSGVAAWMSCCRQRGCNVRAETSDLTPWLPCIANLNKTKNPSSLQLQQWVQQKKRRK